MDQSFDIPFPGTCKIFCPARGEVYDSVLPALVQDRLPPEGPDSPFYRLNETTLQWMEKEQWEFSFDLELPQAALDCQYRCLVFDGLDTHCRIWLNEGVLGDCHNMYHPHRFENPPGLKAGINQLRVRFFPPWDVDGPKARALPWRLPSTNERPDIAGFPDVRIAPFARKSPYHYGWDWGPRFVTMGMWAGGRLECRNRGFVADSHLETLKLLPGDGACQARLALQANLRILEAGSYRLVHSLDGRQLTEEQGQLPPGSHDLKQVWEGDPGALWWCNGLGEPALHDHAVRLEWRRSPHSPWELLEEVRFEVGIRTLSLERLPDQWGTSFQFVLNGHPVFARGSNYIPNHSFLTQVGQEVYDHILASAQASNQNMLRVWGGGFYENEEFYRQCDRRGLMVWQDFMFACAMYPGDDEFLDLVRTEAEIVVRRLRRHACLALWCGNNEIDSAWQWGHRGGWGWKEGMEPDQAAKVNQAYDHIFHRLLPGICQELDPWRDYWPSSPLADWGESCNDQLDKGDLHYWKVWHGKAGFEDYRVMVPRFMSEYGFQSFPEPSSIRRFAVSPQDCNLDSPVMLAHQRSPSGNQVLAWYMERYLAVPGDFDNFILASQIVQAEAIRSAIEAQRFARPRCMGSLYWQLNDCWPAASWSSIDFYGRWKALHHVVRRAYRRVSLVLSALEDGRWQPVVDNQGLTELKGRLKILWSTLDGSRQGQWEEGLRVPSDRPVPGTAFALDSLFFGATSQTVAFRLDFVEETGGEWGNHVFLDSSRNLGLEEPQLQWELSTVVQTKDGAGTTHDPHKEARPYLGDYGLAEPGHCLILQVRARKVARWVHPELPADHPMAGKLWCDDDWFDLLPGEVRRIRIHSPLPLKDLQQSLRLRTVRDICGLGAPAGT